MTEQDKCWLVVDSDNDLRNHFTELASAREYIAGSEQSVYGPYRIYEFDTLEGETITGKLVKEPTAEYWACRAYPKGAVSQIGAGTDHPRGAAQGVLFYTFYKSNTKGDPIRITDEAEAREFYRAWSEGSL